VKIISVVLLFLFSGIATKAQIKSPEQFLGYPIGSRFTPYHKIVDYLEYVASNSKMVKLQQYGFTNEHRPMLAAFVGTESNIAQLENIRINNLQLARQASGISAEGNMKAPAIVWLSYNVHGSEPASSEAAMLTLFALINPENTQTKAWLQNTLVVIDACQNPDGRDRYVNWYNSIVGKNFNPLPLSREHKEPWPGGRTNHYNFDLNRDWAWQTQLESRNRISLYNKWLPQVHVDLHEQGYNAPYYFAPAAEPFHEIITPWQRTFQEYVGRNNARYFDKNNWLYFTRERFDLFYPSYGDTYPMYNGAIGMTYEQGGIGGGLGIITAEGDTLTLTKRALHHFTSSMSTIEVASQYADKLIAEFKKYFNEAVSGNIGTYKSYIIRQQPSDKERIEALKKLLDKNNIIYGTASGSVVGYHYFSNKEERYTINPNDLVISGTQPRAALVQALFEPQSRLSDSATYDITAWAMPYCYGLDAWASRQVLNVQPFPKAQVIRNTFIQPYGLIIPKAGGVHAILLAQLLKEGVRIRIAEKDFTVNKKSYTRGAAIILKTGNEKFGDDLWNKVAGLANSLQVKMDEVTTGMVDVGADFGSNDVRAIKTPRVALLSGEGVASYAMGEVWNYFDEELQYPISLINVTDIGNINWASTDVMILADGNYQFLNNKDITNKLLEWIKAGGRLIALERAVKQISKQDWSAFKLKVQDEDTAGKNDDLVSSKYGERERSQLSTSTPGAIFKVWVDNSHPMFYGYPSYYYTLKLDNDLYYPIKSGEGWNTGVLKKDKEMAGFVGKKVSSKMTNGVLFGVQEMSRGQIVYITDDVLFRRFWENGKEIFFNSVFLMQ